MSEPARNPTSAPGKHLVKRETRYVHKIGELYSHQPMCIWQDIVERRECEAGGINVLYLCEPDVITQVAKEVCERWREWDYIIAHNRRVLLRCPNSIRLEFGTTWIEDYPFPQKVFGVSHLISKANYTRGHTLRRKLWARREEIGIPRHFFLSSKVEDLEPEGYILRESKFPLFDTQFHLAIENCSTKNYFSEKLIDCFQTRTVPIYYGAKNISRYFNTRGMFIVRDADEAVNACNSLTPDTYASMTDAIEDNFRRSQGWANLKGRLQSLVSELSSVWPKRKRAGYLRRLWRDWF
ncbi:MAG: hypothetical protein KDB82_07110 [Planctomycetes bacterium]|nr:hypothetical protein [Planctomycetota bacterium]